MAQAQAVIVGTLGKVEPFDPNTGQSWTVWFKRFNLFCKTNLIPYEPVNENGQVLLASNRRRTFFLEAIGDRAYSVVHAASLPDDPEEFSIDDLAAFLKTHYENPGLVEVNRQMFHARMQKSDEKVADYVGNLQLLAAHCEFGDHYNSALKSQLILGLKHADTKSKLLGNPTINWNQAKTIAMQDDLVREQVRRLAQAHVQVNKIHHKQEQKKPQGSKGENSKKQPVQQKQKQGQFNPCYFCNRKHDGTNCIAKKWKCNKCGEMGHGSAACDERKKRQQKKTKPSSPLQNQNVHHIFKGDSEDEADELLSAVL